jgi:hypothetical protein
MIAVLISPRTAILLGFFNHSVMNFNYSVMNSFDNLDYKLQSKSSR